MPPEASETSLRGFAHSLLQESESVFALTPWASGWLVHESGFELISREVRPALTQTGVSTRSPVQGLSRAELREGWSSQHARPPSLSPHSFLAHAPHGFKHQVSWSPVTSRICHPAFSCQLPTCPTLSEPRLVASPQAEKPSSEKSNPPAVSLPRGCWPLAEPCHLFLASSAAYDFHKEKSINSSSKDWFRAQSRSQGGRSSWKSLDMQIQATVPKTVLQLCIFGGILF